jgi:FKBP-type peptidyl-prolyl cis-trans isomerase 2
MDRCTESTVDSHRVRRQRFRDGTISVDLLVNTMEVRGRVISVGGQTVTITQNHNVS